MAARAPCPGSAQGLLCASAPPSSSARLRWHLRSSLSSSRALRLSFDLRIFYGPGGPYACFSGKDASRALARMSFEENDLIGDISGQLGPFELEALYDWEYKFMSKYAKVGTIKKAKHVADAKASEMTETSARTTECGYIQSKAMAEASTRMTELGRTESEAKLIADDAENKHLADPEPNYVAVPKKVAVKDPNRRVSFTSDIVYRLVPPVHHRASKIK